MQVEHHDREAEHEARKHDRHRRDASSSPRPRARVLTTIQQMTDVTSMIAVAVATASPMLFSVARAIDGNAKTKRYGSSVSVRSAASEGTA